MLFDPHSRLAGLLPSLVLDLEVVGAEMAALGFPMLVVQGLRTLAEQRADYAEGRTSAGPDASAAHPSGRIVTNCDGIVHPSPHQVKPDGFGHAADLTFAPTPARPDPFDPHWPWETWGEKLEARGLTWGGRFHLADLDHAEAPYVPERTP